MTDRELRAAYNYAPPPLDHMTGLRAVAAAALREAAEKAHDTVMLYLTNGRPQDILLGLKESIDRMAAEQEGGRDG